MPSAEGTENCRHGDLAAARAVDVVWGFVPGLGGAGRMKMDSTEAEMKSLSLHDQGGPFAVSHDRDVTMTTRDGIALLTDVYRPVGVSDTPVLVRRTPYGKLSND